MGGAVTRVALVTGGSGGIGSACAAMLAGRGYDVVLAARDADRLEAAAGRIGARWVAGDCSAEQDVARIVDACGPEVHLLVHAAGVLQGGAVRDVPVSVVDAHYASHVRSAYLVTRGVLDRMGAGGRIVYLSSTAGLRPMRNVSAYSLAKAGLGALAESLALEVEADGIAVHVVAPGPVDTPMLARAWHCLTPGDVAYAVGFLEGLRPGVVLPIFELRSATEGPFAPELAGGAGGVGDTGRKDR